LTVPAGSAWAAFTRLASLLGAATRYPGIGRHRVSPDGSHGGARGVLQSPSEYRAPPPGFRNAPHTSMGCFESILRWNAWIRLRRARGPIS